MKTSVRIIDAAAAAVADALSDRAPVLSDYEDAVGQKRRLVLDRYLVVDFVAGEDFDGAQAGQVGWTLYDVVHDLTWDEWSFGTADSPEAAALDVVGALEARDLVGPYGWGRRPIRYADAYDRDDGE